MALKSAKQHEKDKKLNTYHVQIQEMAILISSLQLYVLPGIWSYIFISLYCVRNCTDAPPPLVCSLIRSLFAHQISKDILRTWLSPPKTCVKVIHVICKLKYA